MMAHMPLPSAPPARHRFDGLSGLLCLFCLLCLPGCLRGEDFIRIGVLVSPIVYLAVPCLLYGLRRGYQFLVPNAPYRLPVVALPLIALLGVDLFLWWQLSQSSRDLHEFWDALAHLGPLTTMLMWQAIASIVLVIWRLWFLFHKESSYEGAGLLATALYLGPGILHSLGIGRSVIDVYIPFLVWLSIYAVGATPILIVLFVLEYILRRRYFNPDPLDLR